MKNLEAVGMKVIVRSNEYVPYMVGEVVGVEDFGHPNTLIPKVKCEDGEVYLCASILFPYSSELCVLLDKMTPKEQWEWAKAMKLGMGTLQNLGKEIK